MSDVKTLAAEIRTALDKLSRRPDPRSDEAYNKAFRAGMQAVIEEIAFELHTQTKASKYPCLALAELAETAREMGLTVVVGYDRIMVTRPMSPTQGDDIIEQSFPRSEEIPQLTPVGDTPIGPGDVF